MAATAAAISKFSFGGSDINAVGTVAVSSSRPAIDVTGIGNAKQHFIAGVMGTTVALDVYFSSADHKALSDNMANASSASAFVVTVANLTPAVTIEGTGYVTQCDVVASAGDVVRANITIQCTGDVTTLGTANFDGPQD